jgi:hypothetical protein
MAPTERQIVFESRFLHVGFAQKLLIIGAFELLLEALTDDDLIGLKNKNVFFCYSSAPSSIAELRNVPAVETLQLIDFEDEYLTHNTPEEVVAIILHEIGHVFRPADNTRQKEFNADDFAIERNYLLGLLTSLNRYIRTHPVKFNNDINRARVQRLMDKRQLCENDD